MTPPDFSPAANDAIEAAAADWLARIDRGLTDGEGVEFTAWRQTDLRHEAAFLRLEKVWHALDRVPRVRSMDSTADAAHAPSLARRGMRWAWVPALAAAVAVGFIYFSASRVPAPGPAPRLHAIVHPGPERLTLEDGSLVELKPGAQVDVKFTPTERQVHLLSGEAYFTVAKNPARPFIVSAHRVAVRAVGTAFSVGLDPQSISVLVTEGRVRVDEVAPGGAASGAAPRELSALGAGQQGFIALAANQPPADTLEMSVTDLTKAKLDQALAWQGVRLEFIAVPLGDAVADFNRYNARKLVVRDDATAAILIGGIFRADNLDAFIRLLSAGFGISAEPHDNEIVLHKEHGR